MGGATPLTGSAPRARSTVLVRCRRTTGHAPLRATSPRTDLPLCRRRRRRSRGEADCSGRCYGRAVRLGVISDIHGVASVLKAVLDDGEDHGVEQWWALGDLVLFGPHPVEVLEMLAGLDDVAFVGGNTDRYVLTDDQPIPHATPEDAVADVDLVRRYGLMAAGAAWTRGVLDQAGVLGLLDGLPDSQRTELADGTRLLGLHASPQSDDGRGFDTTSADHEIALLLTGVDTDWVVGGHTHDPTDREVAGIRVLNPGSVGLPWTHGSASWMVIDSGPDGAAVEHRSVGFDVEVVVAALRQRRHPNRDFIASVLARGTFIEAH